MSDIVAIDQEEAEEVSSDKKKYGIELEESIQELLGFYANSLKDSAELVSPQLILFIKNEPSIKIVAPPEEDHQEIIRNISRMLLLLPACAASAAMLSFKNTVLLEEHGLTECIVISTVLSRGILSRVYPWLVEDDEIVFISDAQLSGEAEPIEIRHALGVYSHAYNTPSFSSDIISFLLSKGFDVSYFGDWTQNSVESMTDTV